jgi:hypothetical protein
MTFTDVWTNADPDAQQGDKPEPPIEGMYECALVDADAFTAKTSGQATVKMTWRVVSAQQRDHEWTEILQFHKSQGQANFSKGQIKALGIDVDAITALEQLADALHSKAGGYFTLETKQNGNYRNTYIQGPSGGVQSDIPVDVPDVPAETTGDDEDIPF